MGISDAIDEETMKRLEQNLNNRDVVMDIISETFPELKFLSERK